MTQQDIRRGNFPRYWQHAVEGPCTQGHRWVPAHEGRMTKCPRCKREKQEKARKAKEAKEAA